MTLKDAAKKIPVYLVQSLVQSAALSYAPPYLRESIARMQRETYAAEKERRLAESLGITVMELRVLQNPMFSRATVDRMGLDVDEVQE